MNENEREQYYELARIDRDRYDREVIAWRQAGGDEYEKQVLSISH